MTVINLDDQIVVSSYDAASRTCSFTYEHTDGSRYTVKVPIDDLHRIGPMPQSTQTRRQHLAQRILTHIQTNAPDDHERASDRAMEAQDRRNA